MNNERTKITVDYFSDILCVWAWIAQPRLEELQAQWGSRIRLRHRFVDVFGDARTKITEKYGEQAGFELFHSHIFSAAEDFDDAKIHPDTWTRTRPYSSLPAHLALKAAGRVASTEQLEALALKIRQAFFAEGEDISNLDLLLALARQVELDARAMHRCVISGEALALLSRDLRAATAQGVKGSPTWVLNEGRQVLYGNVGYRILSANIEEMLTNPDGETSWC